MVKWVSVVAHGKGASTPLTQKCIHKQSSNFQFRTLVRGQLSAYQWNSFGSHLLGTVLSFWTTLNQVVDDWMGKPEELSTT